MSQVNALLKHLKSGKTITTIQAMKQFAVCRLSERIRELESLGHIIEREALKSINHEGNRVRWVVYSLKNGKRK